MSEYMRVDKFALSLELNSKRKIPVCLTDFRARISLRYGMVHTIVYGMVPTTQCFTDVAD